MAPENLGKRWTDNSERMTRVRVGRRQATRPTTGATRHTTPLNSDIPVVAPDSLTSGVKGHSEEQVTYGQAEGQCHSLVSSDGSRSDPAPWPPRPSQSSRAVQMGRATYPVQGAVVVLAVAPVVEGASLSATVQPVEAQNPHGAAFMAQANDVGVSSTRYGPDDDVSRGQVRPPPAGLPVAAKRAQAPATVSDSFCSAGLKLKFPLDWVGAPNT